MPSTRQRVIETLQMQRLATAREIGRLLQITPADARHHLVSLLQEGVIVPVGSSPAQGRGRPAQRYSLRSLARPERYDLLAPALLAEALKGLPTSEQESFLRRAMGSLAGEHKPSGSLTKRLVGAIQRLNELGYAARWEARAAAPHLILERRPFEALMTGLPGTVELDVYLLETLLGAPVRRIGEGGIYEVGRSNK
jgi:predicted ArsR family transcriptional regulator